MTTTPATGVLSENEHLNIQKGNANGAKLVAWCTKVDALPMIRDLTAFEDAMLGEYCDAGGYADHAVLARSFLQALRLLLKRWRYKLALVLLKKPDSVTLTRILRDGADILPFAVATHFEKETEWRMRPNDWHSTISDDWTEVIQLLLQNGADSRAFDNHGNNALFYTCMLGDYELFRKLLEKGAAISTTHTFVSWRQVTELNLLRTTLEAFAWQEVYLWSPSWEDYPWQGLGDGWRRIAGDLLDAGQQASCSDLNMVKLLQIGCFQGDTAWVERLIEYGVPIDAPTVRHQAIGRYYACALHAAAAGGQPHVVQLLLDRGANPKDELLSTCAGWEYKVSSAIRNARKQTALAVAIDETRRWAMERDVGLHSMLSLRVSKLWETCELLMDAGSLSEDLVQLLELSAKHGRISLVKRLLQMGYRLSQVCDTRSLETIQLLVQHGSKFDVYEAQKHAIARRDSRFLNQLFGTWGVQVPYSELKRSAVEIVMTDDINMLDVLISFNSVNKALGVDADKDVGGETLLQIACRTGSKATIDFLLKKGADLYLPETDNNALTTLLMTRLKTQKETRDHLWDMLYLIQLVEQHLPEAGKEMRDQCMIKARSQTRKGVSHHYPERYTYSATPDTHLRLPMEGIDGDNFEKRRGTCLTTCFGRRGFPRLRIFSPFLRRPPGQDNFEYTPLPGRDSLRTIILHPATDPDALIECELVPSDFYLAPEYEALSYVHGTSDVPRYIKLDGKVFQITPNLHEALLALRHQSKLRRLWVDAICINQSDNDERNSQVTLMGDIYMNASRVLIWLGPASEDSHLVFQHLERFRQHREDVLSGRCIPYDAHGESHVNPSDYTGATLVALEGLFQRPWFFRTWVIQEKVLGKEAIICCGPESASWEELFMPCSFDSSRDAYRPLHGLDCHKRAFQIHRFRPLMLDACRQVLKYSRNCQVLDPKDRVYGILGLLKPGLIKVKYELDVQEIYRSFTQAVIEDSGNLDILNLCGTKQTLPGMPSWVPDFNAKRPSCHFAGLSEIPSRTLRTGDPRPDEYVTKALPGLRFRNNGKELVVKGKAVDRVRAVGDEMLVSKEYALGTEKFSQTLARWESLAMDNYLARGSNTRGPSADPRSTFSDAFLATLVALNTVFCGINPDHMLYMPTGGVVWYKQHGSGALMRRERQYFEDVEYCMMLDQRDMKDRSYQWYVRELEQAVYGRKLFVTDGGCMGLGDPSVQAGDEIVFLPGSMYPVTIRNIDRDTYKFLGDCYVYGFDVLKLFNDAEKPIVEYIFQ